MNQPFRLPSPVLLWMLFSQSVTLFPLLVVLPIWLAGVWLGALCWSLWVLRGHGSLPSTGLRLLLIGICLVGLYASFGRFLGVEPMVSLLICAVLLKQLELRRQRDAIGLVYLSYFLVACQFLFSQSLISGVYGLVAFWSVTAALVAVNRVAGPSGSLPSLDANKAVKLLLQSVPLMLLMFLVLPRIGALWAVPSPTGQGVTGISDSMSPGDIVNLSRSGGTAFRVSFDGPQPAQNSLYWRAIVMPYFDGRAWRQNAAGIPAPQGQISWQSDAPSAWRSQLAQVGQPVRYRVTLPVTQSRWLYTLGVPIEWQSKGIKMGLVDDWRLVSALPVLQKAEYEVSAMASERIAEVELSLTQRNRLTVLPKESNPETVLTARQWRSEESSDMAYVSRVLDFYRASFEYTLQPPALGEHSVDDFMWTTQQGFCEHFASSFSVMMRAVGIPARVVTGYQGGEYNAAGNYWVVHQYDAHAWVEIWQPELGWLRVDPTAAVAPERIQTSLGQMRSEQVESIMSLGRYRHIPWIAYARIKWDQIQYHWDITVLGFDREQQQNLLKRLLGEVSPWRLLLGVIAVVAVLGALIGLYTWWRQRPNPRSREALWMARIEAKVRPVFRDRRPGETAHDYLMAAEEHSGNAQWHLVRKAYDRLVYQSEVDAEQELAAALVLCARVGTASAR